MAGQRIGVFGKGGCGKSTVTVLLAKTIAAMHRDVGVLDADTTNVGLHLAFGLDHGPRPLLDYFGGMIFSGGRVTCPVDDPSPLPGATITLDQLAKDYYARTRVDILLLTAGKMGGQGPGAGCDGPIAKIVRDVRIESEDDQRVWLIDFKAGFEDTARGVITSLDWALVVVDPTVAAIDMAMNMKRISDQMRMGSVPATEHLKSPELVRIAEKIFREAPLKGILCVLNKVRDAETEGFVRARLAEAGITPIGTVKEDPRIARSWLRGELLETAPTDQTFAQIVARLESAVHPCSI